MQSAEPTTVASRMQALYVAAARAPAPTLDPDTAPTTESLRAELEEALRIPGRGEERSWELYYEVLLREHLVTRERYAGAFERALRERPGLDNALERMLVASGPELDDDARSLVARVGAALIQVDLDLGRFELAGRGLLDLRRRLGPEPPAVYELVANQYRLLTGRHDQIVTFAEDEATPPERSAARRQALLARIATESEALRDGGDRRGEREALYAAIERYVAEPGTALAGRLRATIGAGRLALAAGDMARAAAFRETVRADAQDGTLSGSLTARVLIPLFEAELAAAVPGPEPSAELRAAAERAWEGLSVAWQESSAIEGGLGFLADPARRSLLASLVDLTRKTDGDRAAFELLLRARCLGSPERMAGVRPRASAAYVEWLSARSAGVLEFLPGEQVTLCCAVDRRGVRWFELDAVGPWIDAITTLSVALDGAAAGRPAPELAVPVRELGVRFLPEPLQAWIEPWECVLVGGRELLFDLELEALAYGERGPLGLNKAVTYVSSVAHALELEARAARRRTERAPEQIVLCATGLTFESATAGRLAPLAFEESMRPFLAGPGKTIFLGDQARLETLRERAGRPDDTWTLFAHGVSDPARIVPSGILLASPATGTRLPESPPGSGTVVWWEDLAALDPAGVCVLLTCRGSFGFARPGDGGYARLTGALLRAGAHAVLASPRDLEARDALRLHRAWWRSRDAGLPLAQALVAAKRELAAEPGAVAERWATLLQVHGLGWTPR